MDSGPARVVRPVAEGRIPAVSFIMAAEEIPVSAYASKLLNRVEVAGGTTAFQFEKPAGFDFKPGQSVDLTLLNPPETDSEGNVRTFFIASAPFEDQLRFATRMRDTAFKRSLKKMPLGTVVKMDSAMGSFTLHKNSLLEGPGGFVEKFQAKSSRWKVPPERSTFDDFDIYHLGSEYIDLY